MRIIWIVGVVHGLIGTAVLFLTLHPLRDALDPHALDLAKVGGVWQAAQGLVLMVAASATRARVASLLIAAGTAVSSAMLYFIIVTGERPPIIAFVPIGGTIAMVGWVGLLAAKLKSH